MLSILGKLLCSELGEHKYDMYFDCYNRNKEREVIFYDIYKELREKDIFALQEMLERLLAAIELSIKINRQYMLVWLGTVLTIIALIVLPVSLICTVCGIMAVLTAFGYKSIVYLVNRYCFIDANIILLYKTALYYLIMIKI